MRSRCRPYPTLPASGGGLAVRRPGRSRHPASLTFVTASLGVVIGPGGMFVRRRPPLTGSLRRNSASGCSYRHQHRQCHVPVRRHPSRYSNEHSEPLSNLESCCDTNFAINRITYNTIRESNNHIQPVVDSLYHTRVVLPLTTYRCSLLSYFISHFSKHYHSGEAKAFNGVNS